MLHNIHGVYFDVDVYLLEQLLYHLGVLQNYLEVAGGLQLYLAPVDLPFLCLVIGQELFGVGYTLIHVGTVADELLLNLPGQGPRAHREVAGPHCARRRAQLANIFAANPPR